MRFEHPSVFAPRILSVVRSLRLNPSPPLPSLVGGLLCMALSGCLGGQTGQGDGVAPACRSKKAPIVDPGAAGISIAGLQGGSEGLSGGLHFHRLNADTTLRFQIVGINAARSVTPQSGEQWHCTDHVEVDVAATLKTDDGRLDESFVTTLDGGLYEWTFSTSFALSQINGSYDGSEFPPGGLKNPRLSVYAWRSATFSGHLGLDGDDPDPDDNSIQASGAVGEWSGSVAGPSAGGGPGGHVNGGGFGGTSGYAGGAPSGGVGGT